MSSIAQREMALFCDKLMRLQVMQPYSVTSWWRTTKHNLDVGGKALSLHLIGLAVDCVLDPGVSMALFLRDAQILGLHGLIEGDHVHVQARAVVSPTV